MTRTVSNRLIAGISVIVVILALIYAAGASAQRPYNPLEDFLNNIARDNTNRPLTCNVTRRLDRNGDISYLRMDCRAVGYGRRDDGR